MNKEIGWKRIGILGIVLAIIVTGCATPSPKDGGPSPSASKPVLPETPPAPPQSLPENPPSALRQENDPAPPKTEPAPVKPIPPRPSRPPVEVNIQPKEEIYVHTVKWGGETLAIIASWYTGDGRNWKALAKANPKLVPHRIYEGNKITIPGSLLKTRQPMTKEFVARSYSKDNKKEAGRPKTPTAQIQEEPQLFGPRVSPKK